VVKRRNVDGGVAGPTKFNMVMWITVLMKCMIKGQEIVDSRPEILVYTCTPAEKTKSHHDQKCSRELYKQIIYKEAGNEK
jgi:hypothetical protein